MRFSFILISFYLVFSSHNLLAGELKISRDGYLHNEGTSSIYNINIKLVNPWNQSVILLINLNAIPKNLLRILIMESTT